MEQKKNQGKKVLEGIVVSSKMDKTVTVQVIRRARHDKYEKLIERRKKYYAHHEGKKGEIAEGQKVRIIEHRPLSKLKRWRVLEILSEKQSKQETEL